MDYDARLFYQGIEFGLMEGTAGLLVVKTGSGGNIMGRERKYWRLARRVQEDYAFATIVADNPLALPAYDNFRLTLAVADQFRRERGVATVFYLAVSKGAQYGALYGYEYPWVGKWLLVNLPLMVNWHKTREGLAWFSPEQKVTLAFGERDPSCPYAGLVDLVGKANVRQVIVPGADHNFSQDTNLFLSLPERFLFPDIGASPEGAGGG